MEKSESLKSWLVFLLLDARGRLGFNHQWRDDSTVFKESIDFHFYIELCFHVKERKVQIEHNFFIFMGNMLLLRAEHASYLPLLVGKC